MHEISRHRSLCGVEGVLSAASALRTGSGGGGCSCKPRRRVSGGSGLRQDSPTGIRSGPEPKEYRRRVMFAYRRPWRQRKAQLGEGSRGGSGMHCQGVLIFDALQPRRQQTDFMGPAAYGEGWPHQGHGGF